LDGVKVRDLIGLLEAHGWRMKAMRAATGSSPPGKSLVVTVAGQAGKDVPIGTLKAILRSSGLDTKQEEMMTYTVIYEKGPTSWGAYVPDLPGVITVGDSRDEVEKLIQEAIAFHLDGLREEGLGIPSPSSFAGLVDVDSAA
jgi:predicted RNase H-like HicB family nuclease/predicted RNA binding protein YcfA (HicA-like mRNA interferase family)